MIKLHFWMPRPNEVGHVSAEITDEATGQTEYVSWWPAGQVSDLKAVPAEQMSSLSADIAAEGRQPDEIVELAGLDCAEALRWWRSFLKDEEAATYSLAHRNCSWAVVKAVKAAGGDHHIPWHKLAVQYNVPIGRYVLTGAAAVGMTDVAQIIIVQRWVLEYAKRLGETLGTGAHFFVALGDAATPTWSPSDVYAYACLLRDRLQVPPARKKI